MPARRRIARGSRYSRKSYYDGAFTVYLSYTFASRTWVYIAIAREAVMGSVRGGYMPRAHRALSVR